MAANLLGWDPSTGSRIISDDWKIDSNNLLPVTDSAVDIGSSTPYRVRQIFVDKIGDSSQALAVGASQIWADASLTIKATGTSGDVTIRGGESDTTCGLIQLRGGAANNTPGAIPGAVYIDGGSSNSDAGTRGANVTIAAGVSYNAGQAADIALYSASGNVNGSTGGNIDIFAGNGDVTNSSGGSVRIRAGNKTGSGTAGSVALGIGITTAWQVNNALHFLPGADSFYDIGTSSYRVRQIFADKIGDSGQTLGIGAIAITSDAALTISTPNNGSGSGPTLRIYAGDGSSGSGGDIEIYAGNGTSGSTTGGDITIECGKSYGGSTGGTMRLYGGYGSDASSPPGDMRIEGGRSTTSTKSGALYLSGGTNLSNGDGGNVYIQGGDAGSSGNGGSVAIEGGGTTAGSIGGISIGLTDTGDINMCTNGVHTISIGNTADAVTLNLRSGPSQDITLAARGSTFTLNSSSDASLVGFISTSIVGAFNELKSLTIFKLSTTTGIDGTATGTTNLYTVPSGKTAYITRAVVRCTAAADVTGAATAGIGIGAGEDDIFASAAMTGLETTTDVWNFSASGLTVKAAATEVIKFGIDTGASGIYAVQTLAVDLFGYLV